MRLSTTLDDHPPLPRLPRETRRTGFAVHVTSSAALDLIDSEPLAYLAFNLAAEDGATLACCLLPRRLDWLLSSGEALTARVHRLQTTTTHAARRLGIHRPLWSPSFEARVLGPDEIEATVHRIVEEPVRAGLVEAAAEWPWQMRRI